MNENSVGGLLLWGDAIIFVGKSPETPGLEGFRMEPWAHLMFEHSAPKENPEKRGGLLCLMDSVILCKLSGFFSVMAPGELRVKCVVTFSKFIRSPPFSLFLAQFYGPSLFAFTLSHLPPFFSF